MLVGDVKPTQGIVRVRAAGNRGLNRCPQARVEEPEPVERRLGPGAQAAPLDLARRGLGLALEGIPWLGHSQRATLRRTALLNHVGELVVQQLAAV